MAFLNGPPDSFLFGYVKEKPGNQNFDDATWIFNDLFEGLSAMIARGGDCYQGRYKKIKLEKSLLLPRCQAFPNTS
jgi:hypothetical protein